MKLYCYFALVLLTLFSVSSDAHDYAKQDIVVFHPWARPTAINSVPAAVYLRIENNGKSADTLVSVSAAKNFSKAVEIHENSMKDGMMSMRKLDGVTLAPGEKVEFSPGGKHIMLKGLQQRLEKDARFPLQLHFEKAGVIEVQVYVEGVDQDRTHKKPDR